MVCRNSNGEVLRAASRRVEAEENPMVAKFIAIIWVMDLIKEWSYKNIVVEIDCLQVAK